MRGNGKSTRGVKDDTTLYNGGWDGSDAGRLVGYASPDGLETVADWRCVDGCPVKALGEQSGAGGSGRRTERRTPANRAETYGGFEMCSGKVLAPNTYAGTGTAARFFPQFEGERFLYSAKAGRKERDAGLEEFWYEGSGLSGGGGTEHTKADAFQARKSSRRNPHPTVKPLAVCRWLATLIRPPDEYLDDATLLVPFAGSGSEMIGAMQSGWRNIVGIELSEEYADIAEARLAHWREEIKSDVQIELPLSVAM